MEGHSDTESSQILGDWDFPAPVNPQELETRVSDKGRGSTSTCRGGRVLPPWVDPSYEWGGGKWKEDGRKKKKKKKKKKKMRECDGSGASDLSLEDLMDEYSSLPPQVAEWFWCIEYVAKFVKDLRCILDLMNMGYDCTNDYGRRINELLSLRVLEFMFDPSKSDSTGVVAAESRVEFDLSLSNTHVLNAIRKDIPVSELRPGMPELSKFNLLPFIAHKNMSLPQCALEKLRDVENQTSAAPPTEANDPVLRDEDDPVQTNEKGEVNVIDSDNTCGKTFPPGDRRRRRPEDARVKCTKDGTWLIGGSDDESDMVKGPALGQQKNANIPSRAENVCWKCEKEGTLLICSRSECAAKVHKECLNCPVNFDEDGSFHCPLCWYSRVTMEYLESQKLMSCAKTRLVKFLPLLSRASKRLG